MHQTELDAIRCVLFVFILVFQVSGLLVFIVNGRKMCLLARAVNFALVINRKTTLSRLCI